MAKRRGHLAAYLRICVSARKQNCKKQEIIIRHHLKNNDQHLKNVPVGSNAYLCICVFSKEITALKAKTAQ